MSAGSRTWVEIFFAVFVSTSESCEAQESKVERGCGHFFFTKVQKVHRVIKLRVSQKKNRWNYRSFSRSSRDCGIFFTKVQKGHRVIECTFHKSMELS